MDTRDSAMMEEKRISKGVIRRRASKIEKTDNTSTSISSAVSAEPKKTEAGVQESQSQVENIIKLKSTEESATVGGLDKNNISEQSIKTKKLADENVAISKNNIENKEGKKKQDGTGDVLSVVSTINKNKLSKINEEDSKNKTFPKPAGKKNEFKKTSSAKHNKTGKFINTSGDNENSAYRRHKRKFRSGKIAKRTSRPQLVVPEKKASKRVIRINSGITVNNLSQALGVKASEVILKLMDIGIIATMNQVVDIDTASLIATEYNYLVENVSFNETLKLVELPDSQESLVHRAPVVTVMGHVDHGKTSLLDAVRKTSVTSNEAGGITQHIGAYSVKVNDSTVTFLDTPGHEAFTEMRARGAGMTDIVVLVVAADDGVMPQTIEAINHAKAANVPVIVAINKIDKPGANPAKIKSNLMEFGLVPEDLGGTTLYANVSAKTGQGLKELLELIILQSEILELKANPNKLARGTVVEAKLDKGRGPVVTVLVQSGTININDSAVCGLYNVKVRAMVDYMGNKILKAGPSTPIEIFGLGGVPSAGDNFIVLKDEKEAKRISVERQLKHRESELSSNAKVTLEGLYLKIKSGGIEELKLIVKTDVYGSMEALIQSFNKLSTSKVKVNIIHNGAAAITESDVMLAKATNSIIIAFNVRPESKALTLSEHEGVEIRYYNVIYDAVKDVKDAMEGLLAPIEKENITGKAEVRDVFNVPKSGAIAGAFVLSGTIKRASSARLLRDNVIIYSGHVDSLRRFKEDAKEVQTNYECGILLENFNDIKVGDIIETYEIEYIKQILNSPTDEA